MFKRMVIVSLVAATLCAVHAHALPSRAQVIEGFRLERQGQRLAAAARTEEDREKAEEKSQATEYYEKCSEVSDLRQSRRHEMLEPLKAVDVRPAWLLFPCYLPAHLYGGWHRFMDWGIAAIRRWTAQEKPGVAGT